MRSFTIKPYQYPAAVKRVDTTLNFSVMSPVFPEAAKEKMELPQYNYGYGGGDDEDEMERVMNGGVFKSKIIRNDTTGERIFVNFYKVGRYMEVDDTTVLEKEAIYPAGSDTTWIVRSKKKYDLPNGYRVWESQLSDTASSRLLWVKNYYRKGVGFGLSAQLDTLSQPSSFLRNFFDSFTPSDTLTAYDPFTKKSKLFFDDFLKGDSTARKRAAGGLSYLRVDSTDLPQLIQSIGSLSWSEKKYLDTKKELIGKLRRIQTPAATDALVKIYQAANDTLDIQLAALNSLVQQKTKYAIGRFRDIVTAEPPVLGAASNSWNEYGNYTIRNSRGGDRPYFGGNFMGNLYDSLQLTKTVLTDLLPLINLGDYKDVLMMLMAEMVDSNQLKPADYESYYSKFLLEAKQEVRKQAILEKQKSIKEAEKKRDDETGNGYNRYNDGDKDPGNDDLQLYARLLMPFWDSKPAVPTLMQQMLASADKQLKYTTTLLLLRNKKSIPDTMLTYFASLDEYRYDLYNGLKKIKQLDKFPARYNNHIELGRSKLISAASSYSKPDSVVYLSRLQAKVKGKKGYVYFFKYKKKKDDQTFIDIGQPSLNHQNMETSNASDDALNESSDVLVTAPPSPRAPSADSIIHLPSLMQQISTNLPPVHHDLQRTTTQLISTTVITNESTSFALSRFPFPPFTIRFNSNNISPSILHCCLARSNSIQQRDYLLYVKNATSFCFLLETNNWPNTIKNLTFSLPLIPRIPPQLSLIIKDVDLNIHSDEFCSDIKSQYPDIKNVVRLKNKFDKHIKLIKNRTHFIEHS